MAPATPFHCTPDDVDESGGVACEQCRKRPATVYAIDPAPGGWGGRYCTECATALQFRVVDRL